MKKKNEEIFGLTSLLRQCYPNRQNVVIGPPAALAAMIGRQLHGSWGEAMRRAVISGVFAMMASAPSLHAARVKYKFIGGDFGTVSGCLTTKDHVTVTLVLDAPIPEGGCNADPPTSVKINDGVHKDRGSSTFNGQVNICKQGRRAYTWIVSGVLQSKSGNPLLGVDLENTQDSVVDEAIDYTGQCAPESEGSTSAPGKWSKR